MTNIIHASSIAAVSIVAFLASGSTASADNLIKNGSFERPPVATGTVEPFAKGEVLTDGKWKVVGKPGNVFVVGPDYTCCGGVTIQPEDDEQSLCLTGSSNTATGVRQKVDTVDGKNYKLTFFVGNINNPGQGLGTQSAVKVYVNHHRVMTAVNSDGSATSVNWKKFTYEFMADGTTTEIKFINGDSPTDSYNGLDNVRLEEIP